MGVDPGKFNIVFMSDGVQKLRYTAFQRRNEMMSYRNRRILLKAKKNYKNDRDEIVNIIQLETEFGKKHNSKTVRHAHSVPLTT